MIVYVDLEIVFWKESSMKIKILVIVVLSVLFFSFIVVLVVVMMVNGGIVYFKGEVVNVVCVVDVGFVD